MKAKDIRVLFDKSSDGLVLKADDPEFRGEKARWSITREEAQALRRELSNVLADDSEVKETILTQSINIQNDLFDIQNQFDDLANLNGGERDEVLELKFKSIGIAQRAIVSAVSNL